MTREEIENMQAGREMDKAIHAALGFVWDKARCRVCGWPLADDVSGCVEGNCSMRPLPDKRADEPPAYSTDIAAAALEKMKSRPGRW